MSPIAHLAPIEAEDLMNPSATPIISRWWAEKEFWLVVVSLFVVMMVRLNDVPLRGEEPRRAEVAVEMRYFGDWVVPRQYGDPFLSRPPLHSWLLAASESVFQSRDRWVLRLPSVIAVLLTSILLYGYGRQFLGRVGATASALAYPTCGEVLVQSQLAETEPVFVLFLAGSLLLWHWGYIAKWRSAAMWSAAYGLSALSGLCKGGLQPQVYLLGTIGLYLLWKRNLRAVFSWGHLVGLVVGVAIAAAWAVPCAEKVGWATTKKLWMSDTMIRFGDWPLGEFLWHLVKLPSEVFGSLLPWGILGGAFLIPGFRRSVFTGPDCIRFCGLAFLVAAPTIWLPPGGQTRYLVPLYPCLGVLYGAVVDWIAHARLADTIWRKFLVFWAVVLAIFGITDVVGLWVFPGTQLEGFIVPPLRALSYAAILLGLAAVLMVARKSMSARAMACGVWALAAGAVVVNLGPLTDSRVSRINDLEAAVGEVRGLLPPDQTVFAVYGVHPAVPYLLGRDVPLQPLRGPGDIPPPGGYFCFNCDHHKLPAFPFAWEQVAEVAVDRMRSPVPDCTVVIARRRPKA
jgi:4-amino-4-deoxy-L-arabinose transferase-like glycosyltransferase